MSQQPPPGSGPGQPGLGEPSPELEIDHPLPKGGTVVHFRLRGPKGGKAVVILTRPGEKATLPGR